MSVKVVFIILGIIFYVVRQLSKNSDNKKKQSPRTTPRPVQKGGSNKPKSIDDIFNEFVKEVETANKKPAKVAPPQAKAKIKPQELDWQQVDVSRMKKQKQLLDHEDYHGVSHRIQKPDQIQDFIDISSSEGEVFEFDHTNVDWRTAIVTKEILDRKYL